MNSPRAEDLNQLILRMKNYSLIPEEIKMITSMLVSFNRAKSLENKKEILEKIISVTEESILKVTIQEVSSRP
jgi:hypothetical protein